MDSHRQHLKRGFNWLGTATLAAKIVDFSTVLVLLRFLSKQQVGAAALVVSVGMVVEALNGLGTSEALVQARKVDRRQLDTLFWYVFGAASLAGLALLAAAPAVAGLYGIPGMTRYFWLVAAKQPLVAAALIPLAMLNRELRYQRIAVVNTCATIGAAAIRLGLAALGAGAWSLVAGYAASGLFIFAGALLAWPFWPRARFRFAEIIGLSGFGTRVALANLSEQMFKNVDFLLIGWFYGASPLAVYRIAFDVAMEPAMAVGTLVNRIALPVFARVASMPGQLAPIFTWSLRRVAILVAPLTVALMLVAGDLVGLIHDDHGNSYAAAATPLRILAAAALLRVTTQLLPTVLLVSGRPGTAARLSWVTFATLTTGIAVVGATWPARMGIIGAAAIWLLVYPPLLAWGFADLRRHWRIDAAALGRALVPALAGSACMIVVAEMALWVCGIRMPAVRVGLVAATMAATYVVLLGRERSRPLE